MSQININNLNFRYDTMIDNIFENVNLNIDTDWKLGLVGRNGKGKTTLLKILLGELSYNGKITKNVEFEYFPFEVKNKKEITLNILQEINPFAEDWEIIKEVNLLNVGIENLYKPFELLSGGEQVKVLLATLFLKDNSFLLIDEPTNHLDIEAKREVEKYLKSKKGFILVSHDRDLLDNVIDHIISINNTNIDVQTGNYSSWFENKEKTDNFEMTKNATLKQDIQKLEKASKSAGNWSEQIEKTKYDTKNSGLRPDRGYIGHQAAKMMKRSKVYENRMEKAIEEKQGLLKNIDILQPLTIRPLTFEKNRLMTFYNFSINIENRKLFENVTFDVENGDRIAIIGKNGAGKSSLIKFVLNIINKNNNLNISENTPYKEEGDFNISSNLKISYVSQTTENLKGNLKEFARENNIDESIFKAMLTKMEVTNREFSKNIEEYSEGQKKKVLIAKSISESADIYIWDEPLNYIDILSRTQIEEAILKYNPTMIFIEHDERFVRKIANKIVKLEI